MKEKLRNKKIKRKKKNKEGKKISKEFHSQRKPGHSSILNYA